MQEAAVAIAGESFSRKATNEFERRLQGRLKAVEEAAVNGIRSQLPWYVIDLRRVFDVCQDICQHILSNTQIVPIIDEFTDELNISATDS